jgi:hypothetical protein
MPELSWKLTVSAVIMILIYAVWAWRKRKDPNDPLIVSIRLLIDLLGFALWLLWNLGRFFRTYRNWKKGGTP